MKISIYGCRTRAMTKRHARIQAVLHYIGRDCQPVAIKVEATYQEGDPYAVTLTFRTRRGPVRWIMARDLLVEALEFGHAGQGDVRFSPHPLRDDMLQLELSSPSGHARFELEHTTLQHVLDQCARCVPVGA